MNNSFLSFETLGYFLVILITAPFAWEANKLPPGVFDPLGSGAVPLAVSALILFLCFLGLLRAWFDAVKEQTLEDEPVVAPAGPVDEKEDFEKSPHLVGMLLAVSIIYCLAFQFRVANFVILSTLFLWLVIFLLSERSKGDFVRSLVVGVICSSVFYFIFTRIFVVDLPGT